MSRAGALEHFERASAGSATTPEDGVAAVTTALDAVGTRRQNELPIAIERDLDVALGFSDNQVNVAAARGLPFGEPARDPLEARPPQGACFRPLHQRREMFFADTTQYAHGIVRQRARVFPGKLTKRFMNRRAAIGCRQ